MADPLTPSPAAASASPAPTGLAGLKIQRGGTAPRRRRRWPGGLAVVVAIAVATGLFGPHTTEVQATAVQTEIGRAHV